MLFRVKLLADQIFLFSEIFLDPVKTFRKSAWSINNYFWLFELNLLNLKVFFFLFWNMWKIILC